MACMVALFAASPLAGEDPPPAYDEPAASATEANAEEQVRISIGKLERQLAILFPNSTVHLIPLKDALVVRGGAADSEEATRILQIVRDAAAANNWIPDGNGWGPGDDAIVNMLEVPADPQIMLNVTFAFIERSQLKTLETAAHIFGGHPGDESSAFAAVIDNKPVAQRLIEWVDGHESSSIIATPTMTVLNGYEARLMYPANPAAGRKSGASLRYDAYLQVKPQVVDRDWISLELITSKHSFKDVGESSRVATTVKLREGQSVVLSHDVASLADRKYRHIPLPDPARSKSKAADSKVSVCIVTPELVRPMDPDEVPPLPGFQVTSPNGVELYRYAKTEGYPDRFEATLSPAHSLKDDVQYFPAGPEFRLAGASQLPRPQREAPKSSPAASVQVRFGNPAGMSVSWAEQRRDAIQFVTPGRQDFPAGGVYRLTASNISGRDGLSIHSTLEVYPAHPTTAAYLSHNSVPIEISDDDLKQIGNNKDVTKVVYLPDPNSQPVTAGPATLVAIDSEPGTDSDPVIIAERRGTILLVLRLGNTDEDIAAHEWTLMQRPGLIAPAGSTTEAQTTRPVTLSRVEEVVRVTGRETDMQLIEGCSRIVEPDFPISRVDDFDPEIINVEAVASNRIRVQALLPGVSNLLLSDKDGRTCQLSIFVQGDTRRLQAAINSRFPEASVEAHKVQDAVALTGWVNRPEDMNGIVELCEQFYPRVLNHMHTGGVTQAQIQQTAYFPTGSFGEVFPVPNPPLPGLSPTEAVPSEVTACSSPQAPALADDRIVHLRKAIESLQAAGLAEQVRAVEREIEKEQIAQKERQVEELQLQIQAMRRRLGVPAPIPEAPMPAATRYFR
jgi:Flp pilus assembly secretin CpaC